MVSTLKAQGYYQRWQCTLIRGELEPGGVLSGIWDLTRVLDEEFYEEQ
ncbi:MAG: hypothetical protein ACLTW9_07120 [Enterocloster sp.]